jgi:hypothetical protein
VSAADEKMQATRLPLQVKSQNNKPPRADALIVGRLCQTPLSQRIGASQKRPTNAALLIPDDHLRRRFVTSSWALTFGPFAVDSSKLTSLPRPSRLGPVKQAILIEDRSDY